MATKPVYSLPVTGGVATKHAHDTETNRVVSSIWGAAVVAQLGTPEAEALVAEFQAISDDIAVKVGAAEAAAEDAALWAQDVVPSLQILLASTRSYVVGAVVLTRAENYAYEVVASDPHLTTAGGVMLRVHPAIGAAHVGMFGAVGSGDETAKLHAAMTWCSDTKRKLIFGPKTYQMTRWQAPASCHVEWEGTFGATELKSLDGLPLTDDYFVKVAAAFAGQSELSSYVARGVQALPLVTAIPVQPGGVAFLSSRKRYANQSSNLDWAYGEVSEVSGVGASSITISDGVTINYFSTGNQVVGTVGVVTSTQDFTAPAINENNENMLYPVTIRGVTTSVTSWGNTTKRMTTKAGITGIAPGDAVTVNRAANIGAYQPAKCRIEGISFSRAPHVAEVGSSALGFVGLYVLGVSRPVISRCAFRNFSHIGVLVERSYRPVVSNCHAEGANRAYGDGDGTGYGIMGKGNRNALYAENTTRACRKGLDMQGPGYAELFPKVVNLMVEGGGTTYEGLPFYPNATAAPYGVHNTGFGSHEGVMGADYIGCSAVNVQLACSLRGVSENVSNMGIGGSIAQIIRIMFAMGVRVDGVRMLDATRAVGDLDYLVTRKEAPSVAVLIWNTSGVSNGYVLPFRYSVSGFDIELNGPFIRVDRAGQMPRVVYKNNLVQYVGGGAFSWTSIAGTATGTPPVDGGANTQI